MLVASTPLFYLSNLLNYYLRNDGSQDLAGVGSVIGNLCDIALNITLVLVLDLGTRGAALSTTLGRSSPSPSICRACSGGSTLCARACRGGDG